MRTLLAVPFVMLLQGCNDEVDPTPRYFPLNMGLSWTYAVDIQGPVGRQQETFKISNQGEAIVNKKPAVMRSSSYGTDYLLREDSSGIFRVAKRILTQAEPVVDEAPRYVLKRPYGVGTAWSNWTRFYVTMFKPPYGRFTNSLFYEKPFLMTYEIEAMHETVSVAAGTFKDCIKVVGTADLSLYLDGKTGFASVPITTQEWYAPGVGLVKLVRDEKVNAGFYKGGTYSLELTRYSKE